MKAVRLYAQVLVDVMTAPNAPAPIEKVIQELSKFTTLFHESPLFLKVFDNPTLGDEEKQNALKGFSGKFDLSQVSNRFLTLLLKRNRLGILEDILHQVEMIMVERKGGLIGELTSAVPMDQAVAAGVADAISKKLKKPVQLSQKVDPAIIAGMRVTIGGVTFDGSIKGKLDKMMESFH